MTDVPGEGFHIASAFVSVDPDASGFEEKLAAEIGDTGLVVNIPIVPDTADFRAQVDAAVGGAGGEISVPVLPDAEGFRAQIEAVIAESGGEISIPVLPDLAGFRAQVDAAVAEGGWEIQVPVVADTADLRAQVDAALTGISGEISIPVIADTADLRTQVDAALSSISGEISVPVVADTADLRAQVDAAIAESGGAISIPVLPDLAGFRAQIDAAVAEGGWEIQVPVIADTADLRTQIDAAIGGVSGEITIPVIADTAPFTDAIAAAKAAAESPVTVSVLSDPRPFMRETLAAKADAEAPIMVPVLPEMGAFKAALGDALAGMEAEGAAAGEKAGARAGAGFDSRFASVLGGGSLMEAAIGGALIAVPAILAQKFEEAMTRIVTQAGVAKNQLAGLESGVLQLAGSVGFSPDSLANSLYHVESAFQSTGIGAQQAMDIVRIAAEGARVGGSDLESTTNALTAAMAAQLPGIHNASEAMGALNAIVGAGDMKMQDLAQAMGTGVMAIAKSYGQSITEVGAALAVFGDNNIRGARAATDLRMTWQALAAPMKAGKGMLDNIGLSMTELGNTLRKKGMTAALQEFVDHLKASKIPVSEWGTYVTDIFGKKAGPGIGILVDNIDRLQGKIPAINKGLSGFGSAWAQTQKTMSQQLHELESGFQAFATEIGMKLIPPLVSVFGFLNKNQGAVMTFTGLIAAGAVAFGAYTVAAKLAGSAMAIFDAEATANPIGAIIVGLALLTTAFIEAWKRSAGFRDVIKSIGSAVLDTALQVVRGAKIMTDALLSFISGTLDIAAKAFGWLPGIGPKLKTAAAAIDGFKAGVDNNFNSMISTMQGWQNGLTASGKTAASVSAQIAKAFSDQSSAASKAKGDIDGLSVAIGTNGAKSDQAKQARQQLITDLIGAGVKSTTAKTDVDNYSNAVVKNGTESTQAQGARQKLINDILAASVGSKNGKRDMDNLTAAVKYHGTTSDAYRGARAKLIADLVKAGVSSSDARKLVDNLTTAIKNVPGSKHVDLSESASGTWSITQGSIQQKLTAGTPFGKALGGLITMGSGPTADDVPLLVSKGETVVSAAHSKVLAPAFQALGVPGYAGGGFVGAPFSGGNASQLGSWVTSTYGNSVTSMEKQLQAAVAGAITAAKAAAAAAAASYGAGSKVPNVGGGVGRWRGLVLQALSMLGMSPGFASKVLYQMQTESGGNPDAINNWDSNAARGTPSKGLMQVIGPTFARYHVAGTSGNIYDPLANIAAAINYARSAYGPSLGALGSGHGYANGGVIPEPVVGLGLRSGQKYTFGERGPETVTPGVRSAAGGGTVINFNYYGPQQPTAEQQQALFLKASAMIGVS